MIDRDDIAWVAADWGTSHLRVWAMGAAGRMLASAHSDAGMGGLRPDAFEPTLLALLGPWLGAAPLPVVACGMVGARQGWAEAPYRAVPARPADLVPMPVPTVRDPRLRVWIVPGLCQASPADVMRGEETQIAGFLAQEPAFDGVLCLPGTHTKWVRISAKEVVSFQTFMTGEMFGLLSDQSVLRHAVAGAEVDMDAFAEAVEESLSRPERLAQRLFAIRARATLEAVTAPVSRGRLSGYLVGAELAAAKPYWLGHSVVVAGAPGLARLYAAGLGAQGVAVETRDTDPLTRAGLTRFRDALSEVSMR